MPEKANKKDESVIPKGLYCHGKLVPDGNGGFKSVNMCPYWKRDLNRPEQENGYCTFLEKGDWDFNAEANAVERKSFKRKKDGTYEEITHPPHSLEGSPMGNVGLLWDECKECSINMEDDEDEEVWEDEGGQ